MYRVSTEVFVLPRIGGEQCAVDVAGALESMAPGVDVVLGSLFCHAGITPASCDSCGWRGGCC